MWEAKDDSKESESEVEVKSEPEDEIEEESTQSNFPVIPLLADRPYRKRKVSSRCEGGVSIGVSRILLRISRIFRVFNGCFKGVSRVFEGCFKVKHIFCKGCFKDVSRTVQRYF